MLTIYIYLSLLFLSTKDIYVCFDTLTFTTDSKLQLQTSTFTVSITYDTVIYQSTSGQNHPVYLAVSRARESSVRLFTSLSYRTTTEAQPKQSSHTQRRQVRRAKHAIETTLARSQGSQLIQADKTTLNPSGRIHNLKAQDIRRVYKSERRQ